MFGLVHACRGTLGDELIDQWQAHLCGLCLSLRDSRGQLSRALTNTDAVMLSVLVEAQQRSVPERAGAGPCPLRAMRSAQVVPADAISARLGATASLTLAAAKAGDVVAEREYGLAGSAAKSQTARLLVKPLRRAALADAPMADAVHAVDVLEDLWQQGELERNVEPGDPVLAVTGPTSRAAGRIFASSAVLAGRPENEAELREIGEAFGALAHLIDAVEDLDRDRRSGAFNPITATGTTVAAVRQECVALVRRIRRGFDRLQLTDSRLARALLVDGTHAALHRAFPGSGGSSCAAPAGHHHDVEAAETPTAHDPTPADAEHPARDQHAAPDQRAGRTDQATRDHQPSSTTTVELGYPGQPPSPPGYPPYPPADPTTDPNTPGGPPPPPPNPPKPPFWRNLVPWIGVYCTGYACCASHTNPCTGVHHDAGCKNGGCDCCDACDCCGDGCCCDCNC